MAWNEDIIIVTETNGETKQVSPLDLVDPSSPKVSSEERKERLSQCKPCEKINFMGMCNECGCFMALKTWLADARCPIGKWEAIKK